MIAAPPGAGAAMLEAVKNLILAKDICVLATAADNVPHCSLMAYVPSPNADALHMASLRSSRKYANLTRNPKVSLLVDNRGEAGRENTHALTIGATARPMAEGPAKDAAKDALKAKHPHLTQLLKHPEADIIEVLPETVLLLDGPTEAHFEQIR